MEQLCNVLAGLIRDSGLSLRKLETASKVSAMQYSTYLRGSIPTIPVAVNICEYFNCSLDYLCGIDTDPSEGYRFKPCNYKTFITRYEKLLEEHHTTHWKFSQSHQISESCLRHWKSGQTPKLETVIKIAIGLSSSIDYLLGRTDSQ